MSIELNDAARAAVRRGRDRAAAQILGGLTGLLAAGVLVSAPFAAWQVGQPKGALLAAGLVSAGSIGWAAAAATLRWAFRPLGAWSFAEQCREHAAGQARTYFDDAGEWESGWQGGPLAEPVSLTVGPGVSRTRYFQDAVAILQLTLRTGNGDVSFRSPMAVGTLPEYPGELDLFGPEVPDALIELSRGVEVTNLGVDADFPWRVFIGPDTSIADFFTPALARALYAIDDPAAVVRIERGRYAVWTARSDDEASVDDWELVGYFLAHALSRGAVREMQRTPLRFGESTGWEPQEDGTEHLGYLRAASIARRRWTYIGNFAKVLATLSVALILISAVQALLAFGSAPSGENILALGVFAILAAGVTWFAFGRRVALDALQRNVAVAVGAVALARGWRIASRASKRGTYWRRAFLGRSLRNLTVGPAAEGQLAHGRGGVTYAEGDYGLPVLAVRTFTSRIAWSELPRELPAVDFIPEDFGERLAKLVGGTDVDVESYDFNRRWRVKAASDRDAHALLQPSMIELLNSVDSARLALRIDTSRVAIWDDGTNETVDLASRLDILERFVACIPSHLRN